MTNTTVLNGAANRSVEIIGGALYNPREVIQWINVPGWNGLIICFANGVNCWVYGETAEAVWEYAQTLTDFVPGVNGRRLVRPGLLNLVKG